MTTPPTIVLFGTLDTKGSEYEYVRDRLPTDGCRVIMVDTGILGRADVSCDFRREDVAEESGRTIIALQSIDRGTAIEAMAVGAVKIPKRLLAQRRLDAVLGLGGSNGSYVLSRVAQSLPIGIPKVLVSTIAAGDTRPYVGGEDLTLMYPVVDINGHNTISRTILSNAAAACAAMARTHRPSGEHDKPAVAVSMFGVTTTCCSAIRERLSSVGAEIITFHCDRCRVGRAWRSSYAPATPRQQPRLAHRG
jgi:uncharacterized protein (UPF0261 family)